MTVGLGQYRDLLIRYVGKQRRAVIILAALLLGNIALQLASPQLLRRFIDGALDGDERSTLLTLAVFFLGLAVMTQVVAVGETYLAENVGWTATNKLRSDLALHCLRLDMDFHNARTPGELIERIDGDVTKLGNFFSRFVVHVLGNGLLFAGVLVLLWRIHWIAGAVLTVFGFISLLILLRLRNVGAPRWNAARQASAEVFGFIEERLAGTEDIRANGATAYTMRSSHVLARNLLRRERIAGFFGSLTGSTTVLLFALGTVLSLTLGAYLLSVRAISIGTVFLMYTYTELLTRPIEQIARQMQDLQQAAASIGRVQELLDARATIKEGRAALPSSVALSVELEHVTFGYVGAQPVLRDVSFTLGPGETIGILGRTGSGKTTITRLLCRLYDPQQGAVRLGGVDLREAQLESIRSHVGVVTQDIQLFHASVRDNLTLFDSRITDAAIKRVLDELELGHWYRALPLGLETVLDHGGGLSAGEAQLLAFARVFLVDPGLVILDEASSRLDPATERRLDHAVARVMQGRTGIIIAHRLSTVQRVDTIMVLEQGQVAEYGARAALAADSMSRFAGLLRTGMEEPMRTNPTSTIENLRS
ncbi:MAG: ABC transporter ATP-binding protein [Chloroflexia bacterium]|nr:ABC transporter ATP-binding protein [Chloroflexia bacterium]